MGLFPENDPKFDAIYAEESAMVEAAEAIATAMANAGVSRSELATKLGVSPAEITHRLQGERNITVRKLAATLHALNAELLVASRTRNSTATEDLARNWVRQSHSEAAHGTIQSSKYHGYALPEKVAA